MKNRINEMSDISDLYVDIDEGYVVTWLYSDLLVQKIENGELLKSENFELADLVRMRIFNENKEFHIWRSGNELKYREKNASASNNEMIENTEMIVVGKVAKELAKIDDKFVNKETISIKAQHYIAYNKETGQVGYVDCRFIGFGEL